MLRQAQHERLGFSQVELPNEYYYVAIRARKFMKVYFTYFSKPANE